MNVYTLAFVGIFIKKLSNTITQIYYWVLSYLSLVLAYLDIIAGDIIYIHCDIETTYPLQLSLSQIYTSRFHATF